MVRRALVRVGRVSESDLLKFTFFDFRNPSFANILQSVRLIDCRRSGREESSLVGERTADERNFGILSLFDEKLRNHNVNAYSSGTGNQRTYLRIVDQENSVSSREDWKPIRSVSQQGPQEWRWTYSS